MLSNKAHRQQGQIKALIGLTALAAILLFASCRKFVEVSTPRNQLSKENVFKDSVSATNAILGIYSDMFGSPSSGIGRMNLAAAMCADDVSTSRADLDFVTNGIQVDNTDVDFIWVFFYTNIYYANSALEGLAGADGLSSAARNQLTGEALFMRAWCYFYLSNLWGDVPLVLTTDFRINASLPRAPKDAVTSQLIADLQTAKAMLPVNYIVPDRTRPNKWTATALLARALLYRKDWASAESQAQEILASSTYGPLPSLVNTFLKDSKETIWQLTAVSPNFNAHDGNVFIPNKTTIIPDYPVTDTLLASFEPGDQRKTVWLGSNLVAGKQYYYPFKYKVRTSSATMPPTEYPIVFRLAEIYLIHAEASLNQGKNEQVLADLDAIRTRAGLEPLPASLSTEELAAAVEQERRIELFAESGHRWLDLKRMPSMKTPGLSRADDILSGIKGSNWQATDVLWPVPNSQRIVNPSLGQNSGYN